MIDPGTGPGDGPPRRPRQPGTQIAGLPRRRFLALAAAAAGASALARPAGRLGPPGLTVPANCPADPAHPKRQLRGAWIATVANYDWPSAPGLPAARQKAELSALLDRAAELRLNAVYFQVRPAADALYASPYEPWSQYLTGRQGTDPGYDPLEFAVTEAHRRNLELHAWMNPYRVSSQTDPRKLVPWHPARQHPDWVFSYAGALYYNPGLPAVREFDTAVVTDVARRYDVDGIHFDDYFYPYPVPGAEPFNDDAAFRRYSDGFTDRAEWRRDNVNQLVAGLAQAIRAVKPHLKWGISPFGIWRNASTDRRGSATSGLESYDMIYADTRRWVLEGWVDYITPQLYWSIGFPPAAYDKLVPWWAGVTGGTGVQLAIGQAAYKIGTDSPPAWLDPREMPSHLGLNRSYPAVAGDVYFEIATLMANPLGFSRWLADDLYAYPALVPEMAHHPGPAPDPPVLQGASPAGSGQVELNWIPGAPGPASPAYYAVYRFDGTVKAPGDCDFGDARNLLGTVRAAGTGAMTWRDTAAAARGSYTYFVTAVDRLHHESNPSGPGTATA